AWRIFNELLFNYNLRFIKYVVSLFLKNKTANISMSREFDNNQIWVFKRKKLL
ncbi:hypothetical protein HMPREF1981_01417, partial [Bacteroides pyogenes F0041]